MCVGKYNTDIFQAYTDLRPSQHFADGKKFEHVMGWVVRSTSHTAGTHSYSNSCPATNLWSMAQANRAVAERMVAADEGMPGINVKKCVFLSFSTTQNSISNAATETPASKATSQIAGM